MRIPLSLPRLRLPLLTPSLRAYSQPLRRYSESQPPKDLWSSMRREDDGLVFTSVRGKLIPYFWLRDNCRCSSCVHPATRQRNFDTFELPLDIKPSQVVANESGLEIQWSHDSHVSFYSWDFLEMYIKRRRPAPENVPLEFFGASGPVDSSIEYGEFAKDETQAVGRVTDMIKRKGLALVTGVPYDSAEPTKTLLEKIAFIRVTHYGGFYVFKPDLEKADTAYTNEYLPLHTDNTYFTDPSGLQAFHLLEHVDPDAQEGSEGSLGGRSLFLDGFHAANIVREESPEAFIALASFKLPFHASGNEGIAIAPDRLYPVLERESGGRTVRRIRWNEGDRAVMPLLRGRTMPWYKAAAKWSEILKREELVFRFQLKPGTVLIFNNWRVMHGREAFKGLRKMCGGYINRDDWESKRRNTNYSQKEVFRQVIGE